MSRSAVPPAPPPGEDAVRSVQRVRHGAAPGTPPERAADRVAREEPLEIRVGATSLAVVMRTPGHDAELALGFVLSERVVDRPGQVRSVRHCSEAPDPESADNVVRVLLADGVEVDLERLRRNLYASTSCGICGKATLEQVLDSAPPLDDPARFPAAFFRSLPDALRAGQAVFDATGGLHAAALFAPDGTRLVVREDVGRHNAVDKVIGWAAREGRLPLAGHALMVSGRVSYEIVQKALAARIPAVAAISAPSSLALELAAAAGMLLVGFLRPDGFNVYAGDERLLGEPLG